eukprot:CAMPEP_0175142634 /NCGR_PEP_ID=MMETSP0087-20121206/12928_1 /TAXON_ID=136419 /ORGANISM="Unknown Unknown, Strain D1" /LENGTH=96 /DNA_ID=CAMNT_0016426499 /DNA_START=753 /DNA_END=1040 /DNA_ORIENTATION=-
MTKGPMSSTAEWNLPGSCSHGNCTSTPRESSPANAHMSKQAAPSSGHFREEGQQIPLLAWSRVLSQPPSISTPPVWNKYRVRGTSTPEEEEEEEEE